MGKTIFGRRIFWRYFLVVLVLLVFSFVAFGTAQLLLVNGYVVQEKQSLLAENADDLARYIEMRGLRTEEKNGAPHYILRSEVIVPYLELVGNAVDADIFVTDGNGRILLCSTENEKRFIGKTLTTTLDDASFIERSSTLGVLEKAAFAVGEPLLNEDGQAICYIVLTTDTTSADTYVSLHLRSFLLVAVIVLLLAGVILGLMTYRLVRPLREMAVATRRFAQGDFSPKIKVRGHDEVAELATALNAMSESLSESELMSRNFIGNVSHDLRTPMTTIAGFIDGILDGTIPPEQQKHYLHVVSEEVKRLSRLVRAMLNLSRIDSGGLKLSPITFDLTDAVCTTLLSFESRIENKHLQIEGLENCPRLNVTADRDLLTQVIYNLIDNAVKFTDEGGTIALLLSETDDRVNFTIRNSGPGIAPEELPHVFERFYKSDRSRALDRTGAGLGLYIVWSVIRLHGGDITVTSTPDECTDFSLWLPRTADGS